MDHDVLHDERLDYTTFKSINLVIFLGYSFMDNTKR